MVWFGQCWSLTSTFIFICIIISSDTEAHLHFVFCLNHLRPELHLPVTLSSQCLYIIFNYYGFHLSSCLWPIRNIQQVNIFFWIWTSLWPYWELAYNSKLPSISNVIYVSTWNANILISQRNQNKNPPCKTSLAQYRGVTLQ